MQRSSAGEYPRTYQLEQQLLDAGVDILMGEPEMVERLNRRAPSVLLLTSMCLCAFPALGLAQSPTHERAIAEAYAAWVETVNAKDLEAWSSYLAPGAIFFPPGGPALSSRPAILGFYSRLFQDPRFALDCRLEMVEVAAAEDIAWAHGYCESTFTDPDRLVAHASTKWVKVWKRQPGGEWKCAVNSWNAIGPPSNSDEDSQGA